MAVTTDDLQINITVDSKGAVKGVKLLGKTVEDVGKDMKKTSKEASKLSSSFSKIGASVVVMNQGFALLGSALQKVSRGFNATFGQAVKLEKGVAEITTLLDDATGAQAMFTEEILRLQSQFGTGQEDLAKAFYQALSSGAVNATNATELLVTSQKLATGGVTTLSVAVDGLTNLMNAFGVEADGAVDISDALFIGMKAGKTTIEQLASQLGQASSTAQGMGMSFQELIAATAAVTTGGVSTSQVVTQLRSLMSELSRGGAGLADIYSELGITSIKAAVQQDGLVGTLKRVVAQTDGSTEALNELFGSQEAIAVATTLLGDTIGDKFVKIMDDMAKAAINSGAATEDAYQKMAKTADKEIERMVGKSIAFFTRLGMLIKAVLLPAIQEFNSFMDKTSAIFVATGKAIDQLNFSRLLKDTKELQVVMLTLAGSLAVINFKAIASGIGLMATAMWNYAAATIAAKKATIILVGKWALIAGAVMGGILALDLLVKNWDKVVTLFGSGLKWMATKVQIFWKEFQIMFTEGIAPFRGAFQKIFGEVGRIGSGNVEAMRDELKNLNKDLKTTGENFKGATTGWKPGAIWDQAKKSLDAFNKSLDGTIDKKDELEKPGAGQGDDDERKAPRLKVKALFDKASMDQIRAAFGENISGLAKAADIATQGFAATAGAASMLLGGASALMGAVNGVLDGIKQVIDFIPGVLNKVADIFNSITALPQAILEGLKNVFTSISDMIKNLIPNLLNGLFDIIMEALTFFAEGLPDAIAKLAESLPGVLEKLIERLPEMALMFGKALIRMALPIGLNFVLAMIRAFPKLQIELIKMIPEIAKAFVDGVILGLKEFANELANALGFEDIFDVGTRKIEEGLNNLMDGATGVAEDLFKVLELEQAARGFDLADRIGNAINSATDKAANILARLWQKLVDIWDNTVRPILDFFVDAFHNILLAFDNVVQAAVKALSDVWEFAKEVFSGLVDALKSVWDFVLEKIIKPWLESYQKIFEFLKDIGGKIFEGLKEGIDKAPETFKKLGTAIWEGLKEGLSGIGPMIQKIFDTLNPANLFEKIFKVDNKGTGKVEGILGIDVPFMNFAKGTGPQGVPGAASVAGDSVRNDVVPALLSPEEVVIPRSLMANPVVKRVVEAIFSGNILGFGLGGSLGGAISQATGVSISTKGVSVQSPNVSMPTISVESIAKAFSNAAENVDTFISGLGLDQLWSEVGERVLKSMIPAMLHQNKFAMGGFVGPSGGTVEAGEFVIRKSGVDGVGTEFLDAVNKGEITAGDTTVNVSMTVNTTNPVNESFVRSRLMPTFKEELKKASLNGEFVLSSKGIR